MPEERMMRVFGNNLVTGSGIVHTLGPGESGSSRAQPAVLTPPVGIPVAPQIPAQRAQSSVPVDSHAAAPSVTPAPPKRPSRRELRTMCGCGHDADQHEHLRPGKDCGACGPELCPRFRARRRNWLMRLLSR